MSVSTHGQWGCSAWDTCVYVFPCCLAIIASRQAPDANQILVTCSKTGSQQSHGLQLELEPSSCTAHLYLCQCRFLGTRTCKERTLPLIVSSSILNKQLWHHMKLCCQWFVHTWKYLWAKSSNLVLSLLHSYKPVCRNCKEVDCVHGDCVHGLWEDIDVAVSSWGALCLHRGWKITGNEDQKIILTISEGLW